MTEPPDDGDILRLADLYGSSFNVHLGRRNFYAFCFYRVSLCLLNKWMDCHQLHFRDQHGQRSDANRLSPTKKAEEKRSVGSVDWKTQKRMRAGSLPSKGSVLGHSSRSESSSCIDAVEKKDESQSNTNVCLQSPKKKTRLGWGDGLAEYEKKVEGHLGSKPERGT